MNNKFARLRTLQGEKFFRRDAISSFGYTETVSTTAANFVNQQRPLPDDDMQILEDNFWHLV